jgi:hypothetical protein
LIAFAAQVWMLIGGHLAATALYHPISRPGESSPHRSFHERVAYHLQNALPGLQNNRLKDRLLK